MKNPFSKVTWPRLTVSGTTVKLAALPVALCLLAAAIFFWALYDDDSDTPEPDPVVGAWFVNAPDAPFAYHMFTFHADGTMSQANPDAGNPDTSDSDGMGVWKRSAGAIVGKFVEVTADRSTHKMATQGEISFTLTVKGDSFTGVAEAHFFDTEGKHVRGPLPTGLSGSRVKIP